ncbi:hypothetical protein JCM17960_17140 [Magnetospira thiophila]
MSNTDQTSEKYRIIVHADPDGAVGHFAVSLIEPDGTQHTYGKYPAGTDNQKLGKKFKVTAALGGAVPGEIRDDSKYQESDGDIESYPIDLTEEQAMKAKAFIHRQQASPESYKLYEKNCVDFVNAVLKEAGTGKDISKLFREDQIKDLGSVGTLYGAGQYAIDKAREGEPHPQLQMRDDQLLPEGASLSPEDLNLRNKTAQDQVAFLAKMSEPPKGPEGILAKRTEDWTPKEVEDLAGSDHAMLSAHPEFQTTNDRLMGWHALHYGTGPAEYDATGRMIDPQYKLLPKTTETPAQDPLGRDALDGVLRVGKQVAQIAGKDKWAAAIGALQSGINLLNSTGGIIMNSKPLGIPPLKQDGDFGPKTKGALHRLVADKGPEAVSEAVGLAHFTDHAARRRLGETGEKETLAKAADTAFAPLLSRPGTFKADDRSPKPWGLGVQATLNDLGRDKDPDWTPLKEDGWIGPKTEQAFQGLLPRVQDDELTGSLARNLGFLG